MSGDGGLGLDIMTSPHADERNAAQIAYWNGLGGERWVSHQRMQDALLW